MCCSSFFRPYRANCCVPAAGTPSTPFFSRDDATALQTTAVTLMNVSASPCTPIPMGRCLTLLFCASSTGYQFTSMILLRFRTRTLVTYIIKKCTCDKAVGGGSVWRAPMENWVSSIVTGANPPPCPGRVQITHRQEGCLAYIY